MVVVQLGEPIEKAKFLVQKSIIPSVMLKLKRKFAFGWIFFFPESDKLWQGGREESKL